jgi:hypothetical protein
MLTTKEETITITIPQSQYNFLTELSKKIQTQDNRFTEHPIYLVCDVYDVIVDDDYTPTGMGHDIETRYVYKNPEDSDYGGIEESDVDEYCKENNVDKDDLERLYVAEMPYTVNAHLTDEGAKQYILSNRHNLHKPYTYANSLYRCHDMIELREFLLNFKKD